jgi:hypothetical protein
MSFKEVMVALNLSDFAVYAEVIFNPLPGRALYCSLQNDITGRRQRLKALKR